MRPWLVALCLTAGCGAEGEEENPAEELTCEVLADPANCWAQASMAMQNCFPTGWSIGNLAADRQVCTFGGHAEVIFDGVLPDHIDGLDRFAFTVERDGEECGRFVDTFDNRIEITAGRYSAISELDAQGGYHLRCVDREYESDFDRLLECSDIAIPPPTGGMVLSAEFIEFSLLSISTPGNLFRCQPDRL